MRATPGLEFLPDGDSFVVKLVSGGTFSEEVSVGNPTPDQIQDDAVLWPGYTVGNVSGALLMVVLFRASRWAPPAVLRNTATGDLLLQHDVAAGTVAVPFFPGALEVGRERLAVSTPEHPDLFEVVLARSKRAVGIVVPLARMPVELRPT